MSRNKLYAVLLLVCTAGFTWLSFHLWGGQKVTPEVNVCIIKHLSGIPCPSCGSTRAILSLSDGQVLTAFQLNPFGIVLGILMLALPVWIVIDVIRGQNSLFKAYQQAERHLNNPRFAVPLVGLVLLNWIWNITKGL